VFDDKEVSEVWPGTQAVRTRTERKTVNALGLADISDLLYSSRTASDKASSSDYFGVSLLPAKSEAVLSWR
jgi:hypothetical protein